MPNLFEVKGGGEVEYNFHSSQLRAWDSQARFVFVLAGTQGGKTSFAPHWLFREIYGGVFGEGEVFAGRGGGDYIAATSTYDLFKLKFLPVMREWFESTTGMGRYWSGDRIIELRDPVSGEFHAKRADDPMWGRIILRSAESGSGLESTTAKAAILDECGQDEFTLETWEAVLRRLSLAQGRVLGTTTLYNTGWMKSEVYDRWRAGDMLYDVIQFSSQINPAFPKAEFERARATMAPHKFNMVYLGLYAKPPGLIYDCIDDSVHFIEPFAIPARWARYSGHDFGGVNMASVWVAHDPDRDIYVLYDETLDGGKTTDEHAQAAKDRATRVNFVRAWGGAASEDQYRRDFGGGGWNIDEPPVSGVNEGIARAYALFKTKRLYVFNTCKGIKDELGTYKRRFDKRQEPTEEIEDKRKFHRLDALRYVACGLEEMTPAFALRY